MAKGALALMKSSRHTVRAWSDRVKSRELETRGFVQTQHQIEILHGLPGGHGITHAVEAVAGPLAFVATSLLDMLLGVIAAVNAVVAFFYYAKVVKTVWMDAVPVEIPAAELGGTGVSPALALALGITAIATIVTGLFPGVLAFFGEATRTFASGF